VEAVRLNDSPEHKALLFAAIGAAGGLGSLKLIGPTGEEGQFTNTTYTFEYVPASNVGMVNTPDAFVVIEGIVTAPEGPV